MRLLDLPQVGSAVAGDPLPQVQTLDVLLGDVIDIADPAGIAVGGEASLMVRLSMKPRGQEGNRCSRHTPRAAH